MPTRILGIDPGLTRCGFGAIELGVGRNVALIDVGVFRSSPSAELSVRIGTLADEIESLIHSVKPDVLALERVFAQANLRSVMGTAQISGVVLALAHKHGLPIALHTPSEVKAAVTGNGRANKDQVGQMVTRILGLSEMPKPADAADALAIAICNAWRGLPSPSDKNSTLTAAQKSWHAAIAASKSKP
ncbi:MAG: hypothetical protein RL556_724 [Actinomycetota bacterium]